MELLFTRAGNALSQSLADFTRKKQTFCEKQWVKRKEVLDKMKPKFVEQAAAKGHDAVLEKI
jgi:DNA polymerase-3 subunit alpha